MDEKARTSLSKLLSLVLRHDPGALGIALDSAGWTEVDALLAALRAQGRDVTREVLEEVVATSPKRRFALSDDGRRIRANQGHSVEVELGLQPVAPPELLFHGTHAQVLDAIRAQGLVRGERHHVHLSADEATARSVGARRGAPVLLRVRAGEMHRAGCVFFRSENGVWLTEAVPARYVDFP